MVRRDVRHDFVGRATLEHPWVERRQGDGIWVATAHVPSLHLETDVASNQPHTKRDSGGQGAGKKSSGDGKNDSRSQQHGSGSKADPGNGGGKNSQHDQGDHNKSSGRKSHQDGS